MSGAYSSMQLQILILYILNGMKSNMYLVLVSNVSLCVLLGPGLV